jgi:hypothetical protein
MGGYLWGSGDLLVGSAELELRKDFTKLFSGGLSVDFGHFSLLSNEDQLSTGRSAFTTFSTNQLLIINFFKSNIVSLSLIGGSSIRYFHQLRLAPHSGGLMPYESDEGTFRSERLIIFGGHFRPEIHFHMNKNNRITFAASTTMYNESKIFSGFSISFVHQMGDSS